MTARLSINFPADNQLQRKGAKDADEFFAQPDYRLKNTPPTGSKESNQYASVAPAQSQPQETTESPLRQLANRPYLGTVNANTKSEKQRWRFESAKISIVVMRQHRLSSFGL